MSPWKRLAPGVHVLDHPMRAPGGLDLGTRTTLIELPGGLALHCPGPLSEDAILGARALGQVRWILVANGLHHLFLPAAVVAFPEAELFGVRTVQSKHPELRFAGGLEQLPDGLVGVPVAGMTDFVDEVALIHPTSGTLIAVDLVFNVQRSDSLLTRGVMWINGGWRRFGPTRIFRSQVRDAGALRRSLDTMLEHPFDRVVLAHGDVLSDAGHDQLADAFTWLSGR